MRKSNYFFILISAVFFFILLSCQKTEQTSEPVEPPKNPYAVSYEQALQELNALLDDLDPQTRGGSRRTVASYYTSSLTSTRSGDPDEDAPFIHIFNFENEEGFAIMSGDNRVPSLLALTYGGSLIPEDSIDNPGLATFLSRLPDYFEGRISTRGIVNPPLILVPPGFTGIGYGYEETIINPYMVNPMTFDWHQTGYFNDYCWTTSGKEAYAGCVPVAIGQLMTMFRYPSSYGGYSFDWIEMNENTPSTVGKTQIARLLQQLGLPQNLNVSYGAVSEGQGSGASPYNIARTLRNFSYACNDLSSYSSNTVISELIGGYPCIVGGESSEGGGHCWLVHGLMARMTIAADFIDGVRVSDYRPGGETVHYLFCNMGWEGKIADGYYLAGVFDAGEKMGFPSDVFRNYKYYLQMVTGIRKN